jgi:hypothetical protein
MRIAELGIRNAEFRIQPEGLSYVTQGFSPDDSAIRIRQSALGGGVFK